MNLLYIDGAAVHAALPYPLLVEALRKAFAEEVQTPVRSSHAVTDADDRLLVMPAWRKGEDLGVKIVTVFPGNRERALASVSALYLLLDGATGHPRALIDGEALTLRRTAASSALASTYLSRPESSVLLVVGSGALAPYLVAAHAAVRPIRRILVWGRSPTSAEGLVQRLKGQGLDASRAPHLREAVGQADIVTCATTAREPLVRGEWVRPGTHVDLVGAFTPEMRESDDALIAKAAVFVDTYSGALKEAGDLMQALESGVIARAHVRADLHDLTLGRRRGRENAEEITVFKSVGTALEDLCAARLVFDRVAAG